MVQTVKMREYSLAFLIKSFDLTLLTIDVHLLDMGICSPTSKSACMIYDEMKSPPIARFTRGLGLGPPARKQAVEKPE